MWVPNDFIPARDCGPMDFFSVTEINVTHVFKPLLFWNCKDANTILISIVHLVKYYTVLPPMEQLHNYRKDIYYWPYTFYIQCNYVNWHLKILNITPRFYISDICCETIIKITK